MREEWKEVELGSVLKKIKGGGTPSKKKSEYWDGNISWCSVKDMSDNQFYLKNTIDYITEIGLKNSSANLIPKGTVITSTRMGLGRVFIALKDMAINQDLKALFPNEKIDNQFLLWTIVANKNNLESLGTGSTVKGIRLETLKSLKIHLPPLSTQRKIAQILSAYDDLIENNRRRIALLEEQAQQTYEEWFVRLRFPGFEDVEVVDGLPFGWRKLKLKDCAILTMGQSPKSSFYNYEKKGLPFHQGVKDYGFRFPNNSTWSTEGKRIANEGDILFSVRAPVGRLNIAFEKIILGRGLASIRHKNNWSSFLFYQLQKIFFQEDIMGGGSIFNSVTKTDMQGIKILHGTDEITAKFNDLAKAIDLNIKNLTHQNRLLQEARDILLPRLMLGLVDPEKMSGRVEEEMVKDEL